MALFNVKKATFKIKDGDSPQNELEVQVLEGSISWVEKRNIEYRLSRGVLADGDVREGDQIPLEVTMNLKWEFFKSNGSESITPEEALKKIGGAAAWVSSDTDPCRPYCVDLEISYVPDCGTAEDETITLEDFRYEEGSFDLKAGTAKFTGKCNRQSATVVRS